MLIVGLGNPGPNYESTRHNIGFMVIDELVKRLNAQKLSSSSFKGELFKFSDHYLLKPLTFMNLSGISVAAVKKFYKIDEVVVIHDDLDIEFGIVKFKCGGGTGGHNGLESIVEHLGNADFNRLRFGIGRPPGRKDPAVFVLSGFRKAEKNELDFLIDRSISAIKDYIDSGIDYAMNEYNN